MYVYMYMYMHVCTEQLFSCSYNNDHCYTYSVYVYVMCIVEMSLFISLHTVLSPPREGQHCAGLRPEGQAASLLSAREERSLQPRERPRHRLPRHHGNGAKVSVAGDADTLCGLLHWRQLCLIDGCRVWSCSDK